MGNVFLAYSRYLLPYRPFTQAIAEAVDIGVAVLINTASALMISLPLLRSDWRLWGVAALPSGVLMILCTGFIVTRILARSLPARLARAGRPIRVHKRYPSGSFLQRPAVGLRIPVDEAVRFTRECFLKAGVP